MKFTGSSAICFPIGVVTCLLIILLASLATAVDQAQKAETAESKAGVLEQNSSAKGSKESPARSEIITDTEAQAVDPIGKEPLDHAITCLSRTIYWEAKDEGAASSRGGVMAVRMSQKRINPTPSPRK